MLLFMLQPDCNMAGIALASELSDKALEYISIFGVGVGCPASAVDFCSKKCCTISASQHGHLDGRLANSARPKLR
jgi:hypothetical protein